MKSLKLFTVGLVLFFANTLSAQVSVNVNIGSPPSWGPYGYSDVRYYYLPDVEAYYDIETSMFIYYGGGVWVHRSQLPTRYRYYDLYSGYKVVMTGFHGNSPHYHFKEHKIKYAKGYKGGAQKTIGNKPGKGNSNEKHDNKNYSGQQKQNSQHKSEPSNNNTKHMNSNQGQVVDKSHGGGKGGAGKGGGGKGKNK